MNRVRTRRDVSLAAALLFLGGSARAQDTAPPRGDDTYRFLPAASQESPAVLTASGPGVRLTWPGAAAPGWDTALLGVKVAATGNDPRVGLSAGGTRIEQYLDPGANGLRWLNLTGLRDELKDGATVDITPTSATLEPQSATVRVFANKLDLEGPILILAPHPDDAEIAAFGFYTAHHAHTTVVTVTSGNAGDANFADNVKDPAQQYLLKGYLRAVDSVTVPWQGGIPPSRTYNLGYFDARLKTMREKPAEVVPELYGPNTDLAPYRKANVSSLLPNGSRPSSWNNLVADLVSILQAVKPATIVMPYPQLDSHADHQYTAVAAYDALQKWPGKPRFLLYTNHAMGTENRYPYGPAGTVLSLPPWSGAALPVQGVYAQPVSPDVQLRKLFALETMHDLRLSPAEQDVCGVANAPRRPDYPRQPAVDYLRRGPRPQELFFVYDRAGVQDALKSFLAAEAQARQAKP